MLCLTKAVDFISNQIEDAVEEKKVKPKAKSKKAGVK
jgi:hypothetical protein